MTKSSKIEMESLIENRVRNRIFECLSMLVDGSARVNIGINEIINLWYDFVPEGAPGAFPSPVFSKDERDAILEVCVAIDRLVAATPNPMPEISCMGELDEWLRVIDVASTALATFRHRGPSLEE